MRSNKKAALRQPDDILPSEAGQVLFEKQRVGSLVHRKLELCFLKADPGKELS